MSRIQDALKRAEEEKAARGSPGVEAVGTVISPGTDQQGTLAAPGPESLMAIPTSPTERPPNSSAVLKTLAGRCKPRPWNPEPMMTLFTNRQSHVVGSEEFRTLRSRLYLARNQQPLQRLLITSPLPKEGKTFVAANLARVIVQQPERRVLLIDSDLRLPALHRLLGTASTPGLSDYLNGDADEFSTVQRGALENFFFIPCGNPASNPSELIGNGRLRLLLDCLSPGFDWIILDSPPAILMSDAKLLADVCDGVLMLIQAGTTPYDIAQKACLEFRTKTFLGVVLNRADAQSTYGSYYHYGKRALEQDGSGG